MANGCTQGTVDLAVTEGLAGLVDVLENMGEGLNEKGACLVMGRG